MPRSPERFLVGPPAPFDASGVFETCRVAGGKVLHLKAHWERLEHSARTVGLGRWPAAPVRRGLEREAARIGEGFVRVLLARGGSPRWRLHSERRIPYSGRRIFRGASVTTVPTRWPAGESGPALAKMSERLLGILCRIEGGDADEALRMGPGGFLTEGTVSNLFFVRSGVLQTPPSWVGALEGVTRAEVIAAARRLGLVVRETPFSRHELFNAEEAFLTNVLMAVFPVRQVDGRRIGKRLPGPWTGKLMRALGEERKP